MDKTEANSTDYFYNSQLAGQLEKQVIFSGRTIICGDGLDNAATNAHISMLPNEWLADATSPSRRHYGGAHYLFVDGHVNWKPLASSKVSDESSRGRSATFAIK